MSLPRASPGVRSSMLPGVSARTGADVDMPAKRSAEIAVRKHLARNTTAKRLSSGTLMLPVIVSRWRHRAHTLGTRRLAGLRLCDALAVLLPVLRPVGEQDAFADPRRLRQARHGSPEHERLVAVAEVPGVEVLVLVHFLIGPGEPETAAQLLDVLRLSGEKLPAWPHAERLGVLVQHLRRVQRRVERDRIHEKIAPDAVGEQLLHPHEICRGERAGRFAGRVHHVDGHELAFYEVVVEADLLAFVRGKY